MSRPPRRPNFFIIGAAKSGTSWLHRRLNQHPQIFLSEPKEPFYFIDPEQLRAFWLAMYNNNYWRSEAAYLELFREAGDVPIVGESSTGYTMHPVFSDVPRKLHAFNPDAKLLYMLREPTGRTISQYWHHVRNHSLKSPPMTALQEDPIFLSTSYYAQQLEEYLQYFAMEQIYVTSLEEMRENPEQGIRRILAWLGVDATAVPQDLETREHVTPEVVQTSRSRTLQRLGQSTFGKALRAWLPAGALELVRPMTHNATRRGDVDLAPVRHFLDDLHAPRIAELETLLGRSFPEWRAPPARAAAVGE
jgi:hypothetical protein